MVTLPLKYYRVPSPGRMCPCKIAFLVCDSLYNALSQQSGPQPEGLSRPKAAPYCGPTSCLGLYTTLPVHYTLPGLAKAYQSTSFPPIL